MNQRFKKIGTLAFWLVFLVVFVSSIDVYNEYANKAKNQQPEAERTESKGR